MKKTIVTSVGLVLLGGIAAVACSSTRDGTAAPANTQTVATLGDPCPWMQQTPDSAQAPARCAQMMGAMPQGSGTTPDCCCVGVRRDCTPPSPSAPTQSETPTPTSSGWGCCW